MRKLEAIRKMAKKITKENDIYDLDVSAFRRKGCVEAHALPHTGYNGELSGIAVEQVVLCRDNEGDTYYDTFFDIYRVPFPKARGNYECLE